jgi:condensin complex subunit 1
MSKLLDSITSGLLAQTEAILRDEMGDQRQLMEHKTPLEMYAFLFLWFVLQAEKVKGEDGDGAPVKATKAKRSRGGRAAAKAPRKKATETWSWDDHIVSVLTLIPKVLKIKTQRLWTTVPERDAFISCVACRYSSLF